MRRTQTFSTVQGTDIYSLTPPTNEEIIGLKYGQIQDPASGGILSLALVYGDTMNPNLGRGMPQAFTFVPYLSVKLYPVPDKVYNVTIEFVVQPIDGGVYIPDEIGVRYKQTVADGALSNIMLQNGNPWYNPQMAEYYAQRYNKGIARAKGEAAFGFGYGPYSPVRKPFGIFRTRWGW